MREVIRIDKKEENEKPVEFTHWMGKSWKESKLIPSDFDKVVYLGDCIFDGDMFACYRGGEINIYKGYLNSGKYE